MNHQKTACCYKLAQLSQLGTEIGTFDSARAVSFHHKSDYSVDGYTLLAVAALAISRSSCRILFAALSPAGCTDASQVFGQQKGAPSKSLTSLPRKNLPIFYIGKTLGSYKRLNLSSALTPVKLVPYSYIIERENL
jgi:hypothetical protein